MESNASTPCHSTARFSRRLIRLAEEHPWWTVLVVLLLMVALMYPVQNWCGRRVWEQAKCELEVRGETLDYSAFVRPQVPDDQNVAEHPFFRGRFLNGQSSFAIPAPSYPSLRTYPHLMAGRKALPFLT